MLLEMVQNNIDPTVFGNFMESFAKLEGKNIFCCKIWKLLF